MELIQEEKIVPVYGSRLQSWKRRLRINRKLIALKFLIFLMNGATSVLYPFFTIHSLSTGLTLTETGIIFGLIPIFGCFGNPLAGFLADKLGDYKKVVISFILLSVLSFALLGFVVPNYSRKTTTAQHNLTSATLNIKCSSSAVPTDIFINHNPNLNYSLTPDPTECIISNRQSKNLSFKSCKTNCETGQSICFPTQQCFTAENLHKIHFIRFPSLIPSENVSFLLSNNFTIHIPEDALEVIQAELFCSKTLLPNCEIVCDLEKDVVLTCNQTKITGNRLTTFFLYTLFRVVGSMAVSCVMQLLDAATLVMVKEHNGDFGIQRTFGVVGSVIFPPLGGYLVGVASSANKKHDYSPIFYLFCCMFTLGAVVTWLMELHVKPPGKQIWANVWRLMKNVKVSSFVVVIFLVGCFYGILENYLFWYMEKFLNSPKWLLGMTNTVAGLSAIPVVAASSWIIKLCGHTKIFMLSFIVYGVRFLAYSFVYDPYLILPVEVLEALTFSLTWVVATVYSGKVAPGFVATLQGVIGAMHYSFGRGLGALIAGALFDYYPPRFVYQLISGVAVGTGLFYAVLHYVWLRKAPDPKSPRRDAAINSTDTQQMALNSEHEGADRLDEVQAALLEVIHPYQTPLSPTEDGGDSAKQSHKIKD